MGDDDDGQLRCGSVDNSVGQVGASRLFRAGLGEGSKRFVPRTHWPDSRSREG